MNLKRPVFKVFLLFSTLLLFAGISSLHAQDYRIVQRSIGIEDGLTSVNVRKYYFDRDGFTWIGTDRGLNRFDGNQVKAYTVSNQKLLGDRIGDIAEDFDG